MLDSSNITHTQYQICWELGGLLSLSLSIVLSNDKNKKQNLETFFSVVFMVTVVLYKFPSLCLY